MVLYYSGIGGDTTPLPARVVAMFALTKKTDYGIIALADMARHPQTVSNARQIAERYGVPAALLSKVLKVLAQQEIVRSIRGVKGGYLLAMPAEEITLTSVIEAIEGPVRFVQCAGDHDGDESLCELTAHCPVTRPIQKVHKRMTELLDTITLADLVIDSDCAAECIAVSVEGQALETEPLT